MQLNLPDEPVRIPTFFLPFGVVRSQVSSPSFLISPSDNLNKRLRLYAFEATVLAGAVGCWAFTVPKPTLHFKDFGTPLRYISLARARPTGCRIPALPELGSGCLELSGSSP
jgi:hypothetical protein